MDKATLAQYLVNLHTLLSAQDAVGSIQKSEVLLKEYEEQWGLLKEAITNQKEATDERRL